MKIHKKLVIGTANFKKRYGLNPTSFFFLKQKTLRDLSNIFHLKN